MLQFAQVAQSSTNVEGTLEQFINELPKGTEIKISAKSILFINKKEKRFLTISKAARNLNPAKDWIIISFTHEDYGFMTRVCPEAKLKDGSYLLE